MLISTDNSQNQGGFMKKIKMTGLLLGLFLMANTASASFLIEPHLGYNVSGSGDNGLTGASKVENDYSGAQYGLKLGYQNLGLMVGLDFNRSNYDQDFKSSAATATNSMERSELGLFVGYNLPILVRAWGAYYFSNNTKNKDNSSEMTGNTKELGVGFTGLPFLSINLMYRMIDLDELEAANGTKSSIDVSDHEVVLGVSVPLTL